MRIMLNGEIRELMDEVSLDQLLKLFLLPSERVAVELNQKVVRKMDWQETVVRDADRIEVIHFVGGG